MQKDLRTPVRQFIRDNFLFREDIGSFADEDSFLDAGIIDSTGVLELISFLEGEFGIEVADHEMIPENFDSVARIVAYLKRKLPERAMEDSDPVGLFAAGVPSYAG